MNEHVHLLPTLSASTQLPALPDPSVLPDELLQMPRWLLWRYVHKDGQAKPAKVPYYVDASPRRGTLDSPEDVAHAFVTVEEILKGEED